MSGYLGLAVGLSSRVQRTIGYRMWRRLHYATFAVYGFAVIHTPLIGNDRSTTWGRAVVLASLATVVAFTTMRVLTSGCERPAEAVR